MHDTNILIVEDDAIAQLTFVQYLRDLDYDLVTVVSSGAHAIEAVQNQHINLAFLDIRIRGNMNGLETAKHIKSMNPHLPIVFLTASTDRLTIQQALDCQPYSIINKPYDLAILRETIEGALNYQKYQEKGSELATQHMLDQILDTTDVGIAIVNSQGNFIKVNKAYCTLYGYAEQELIGQHFARLLPESIQKYARTLHREYLAGETEEGSGEWPTIDKQGNTKDVYVRASRLIGEDGQRYKIMTVNDITERKDNVRKLTQALDEKESYAQEVHHRVKNNMNIVSGLLYLQAEKVKDQPFVYDLFQESIVRIKTLSLIQEQLYHYDNYTFIDLKEYTKSLVNNVKSVFRSKSNDIRIDQCVVQHPLDVDKAIACGLIINEVLTNCFKYAFPSDTVDSPQIIIESYLQEKEVHITMHDNGVGLPAEFDQNDASTLGFQLISNLTQQLSGKIEVSNRNGTYVHLQFPH